MDNFSFQMQIPLGNFSLSYINNNSLSCSRQNLRQLNINILNVIRSFLIVGYPSYRFQRTVNLIRIPKIPYLLSLFDLNSGVFKINRILNYLEPSEKNLIAYELGMLFSHLLSENFLNISWTLHLHYIRNQVARNNSNIPDLIAYNVFNRNYYVLEAKGSLSDCRNRTLHKAKQQVNSIRSINGIPPSGRYVSYFTKDSNDDVITYWIDPKEEGYIDLEVKFEDFIKYHYRTILFNILLLNKQKGKFEYINISKITFKGIKVGSLFIGLEEDIFNNIYKEDEKSFLRVNENNKKYIEERIKHIKKSNIKTKQENYSLGDDGILVYYEK